MQRLVQNASQQQEERFAHINELSEIASTDSTLEIRRVEYCKWGGGGDGVIETFRMSSVWAAANSEEFIKIFDCVYCLISYIYTLFDPKIKVK